jgi:hypothetical protein
LASIRPIGQTGFKTPLLVPSFSSRGFSPIGPRFERFSPHTAAASLVSAYDIYHGALPLSAAYGSDIVFLDSGGYEGYSSSELSVTKPWSVKAYREVLARLENRTTIMTVTFDYENRQPTEDQITAAAHLANDFPRFSWDCLLKPESSEIRFVNVQAVINLIPSAPQFTAFGFTEAELGGSVLERARNIIRIRKTLKNHGRETPIHLFGCLDPLAVRFYFAAGADIFDGLQWLRSVMTGEDLFRMSSRVVQEDLWDRDERAVEASFSIRNLEVMRNLQRSLRRFAAEGTIEALELDPKEAARFEQVISTVYGGNINVRE